MKLSTHPTAVCLTVAALAWTGCVTAEDLPAVQRAEAEAEDRPFLALWRSNDGMRAGGSESPYLRYAVWSDGRVLFAKDPAKWGHELQRGKLTASRVARLKAALVDTGVLDLKGTCYLLLDRPMDCLFVDLGGEKRQLLYWDEVEHPWYGINVDPKPHHLEFKRCWKVVNHLALVALPDDGETVPERVQVPESWYIKRAIQSE